MGDLTYTYDAAGQRTTVGGSFARTGLPHALASATYDAGNRLATWPGQIFGYDLNGNLTSDGTTTYTWNARNELTALTGGASAGFSYDGIGRRRGKTISGTTTNFSYDGLNVVQEATGGGTPTANLLTGLGIDETFTRTDATGARTLLIDAIGSTQALADAAGTVQSSYTYDAFGATSVSGATTTNAAQFTGRENDGTGLYFLRARYYNPQSQRFLSEDPIGHKGGANLFAYAADRPTEYLDPLGMKPSPLFGQPPDQKQDDRRCDSNCVNNCRWHFVACITAVTVGWSAVHGAALAALAACLLTVGPAGVMICMELLEPGLTLTEGIIVGRRLAS